MKGKIELEYNDIVLILKQLKYFKKGILNNYPQSDETRGKLGRANRLIEQLCKLRALMQEQVVSLE